MAGLQKILKIHGSMKVQSGGKTVTWLWDYANNKARLETDMSKEEIAASEKAKWDEVRWRNIYEK